MSRRKGFTLAETLVVAAIVAILVAITMGAVSNHVRAKATETELKARLRQLAMGVAMYMADHDDKPPASLEVVASGLSLLCPRSRQTFSYPLGSIARPFPDGSTALDYGFDFAVHSIIKVPGWNDWKGPTRTHPIRQRDGSVWYWQLPTLDIGDSMRLLGVRLDGSVDWFPEREDWVLRVPQFHAPPPAVPKGGGL